jgi:hypothetical protein
MINRLPKVKGCDTKEADGSDAVGCMKSLRLLRALNNIDQRLSYLETWNFPD